MITDKLSRGFQTILMNKPDPRPELIDHMSRNSMLTDLFLHELANDNLSNHPAPITYTHQVYYVKRTQCPKAGPPIQPHPHLKQPQRIFAPSQSNPRAFTAPHSPG